MTNHLCSSRPPSVFSHPFFFLSQRRFCVALHSDVEIWQIRWHKLSLNVYKWVQFWDSIWLSDRTILVRGAPWFLWSGLSPAPLPRLEISQENKRNFTENVLVWGKYLMMIDGSTDCTYSTVNSQQSSPPPRHAESHDCFSLNSVFSPKLWR